MLWRCISTCYQLSGYTVHYDDSRQLNSKNPKKRANSSRAQPIWTMKHFVCEWVDVCGIVCRAIYVVLYQSVRSFPVVLFVCSNIWIQRCLAHCNYFCVLASSFCSVLLWCMWFGFHGFISVAFVIFQRFFPLASPLLFPFFSPRNVFH